MIFGYSSTASGGKTAHITLIPVYSPDGPALLRVHYSSHTLYSVVIIYHHNIIINYGLYLEMAPEQDLNLGYLVFKLLGTRSDHSAIPLRLIIIV